MSSTADKNSGRPEVGDAPPLIRRLEQRSWRNWLLLSGITLATTIGLAMTSLSFLWPREKNDLLMLGALTLLVFIFVGYLTRLQRQLFNARKQMDRVQKSASEQRYSRLFELLDVARVMDSESENIFDCIPKICVEVFGCQKASLMLANKDSDELEVQSAAGYADRRIIGARRKVGEGVAGWVAKNRKPVLLQDRADFKKYPGLEVEARDISAAIVVPIIAKKRFLGVLNISTSSPNVYYDEEDLRALQAFARNVGSCILHLLTSRRMKDTIQEQQRALQEKFLGLRR